MPAFGGKPRWSHFSLLFDGVGMGSVLKAVVLNPVGVVATATEEWRLEFLWLSFIPFGLLGLRGWRASWFLLLPLGLLIPAGTPTFFIMGINYSAPIMPAVVMMSSMGLRALAEKAALAGDRLKQAKLGLYLAAVALSCNWLYGNILSKSYKMEFGELPYRRMSQYDHRGRLGYNRQLPPYGPKERAIWQAIDQIPPKARVATSWSINPQLATREVSMVLPYLGERNPPGNQPEYVIIDKLPPMIRPTEAEVRRFRADPTWTLAYENEGAVVFKRR
jgi:hypothetical protein